MNVAKWLIWVGVLCSGILCLPRYSTSAPRHDLPLRWINSTPFPESRSDYAAGVLDEKLVIAGGTYWEGSKGHWIRRIISSSVNAFDPTREVWEKLPDLPTPLAYAASAVIGGKLFVLGGYTGTVASRKIYALERESGKYEWRDFGVLPENRLFAQAVSAGGRLFLLGGTTQFEPLASTGMCCTSRTATNRVLVLDTAHPEMGWSQLAPLPGPRRSFFSAITDGRYIWTFGGSYQAKEQDSVANYNQVFRYEIARGRWQEMKSLPKESADSVAPSPVMANGKIILVTDTKTVWLFDPMTTSYIDLVPLPEAAAVDKFVWIKGRLIGAGGENELEGPRRRSSWTFIGRFGAGH